MSKRKESTAPWYRDGLAFSCTRCGACCTGAPGYVWVSPEEIDRLAEFRGETVEQFAAKFVRRVGDRYSLIEKPGGDCIFWDKQRRLHGLSRPSGPVPDLALLAGKRRDPRRLGPRSSRSAPARAEAVSTPWMRSFHPSRRPRNDGSHARHRF